MSLHADESAVPRQRSREQPTRPALGKEPATLSLLCASAQRRDRRTRSLFLEQVLCRRPSRAPWGPALEHQHDGGPSPAVVSAAGLPCPCLRGARRSSPGERPPFFSSGSSAGVASSGVPTPKRRAAENADVRLSRSNARPRHTHYHPSSRRADVGPSVVFHAVAPIRVEPASAARRLRLDFRNRCNTPVIWSFSAMNTAGQSKFWRALRRVLPLSIRLRLAAAPLRFGMWLEVRLIPEEAVPLWEPESDIPEHRDDYWHRRT